MALFDRRIFDGVIFDVGPPVEVALTATEGADTFAATVYDIAGFFGVWPFVGAPSGAESAVVEIEFDATEAADTAALAAGLNVGFVGLWPFIGGVQGEESTAVEITLDASEEADTAALVASRTAVLPEGWGGFVPLPKRRKPEQEEDPIEAGLVASEEADGCRIVVMYDRRAAQRRDEFAVLFALAA